MLAVCKSNGLFEIIPDKEFAYECPFVISTPYSLKKYYVTPSGCLLYYQGAFYNPCRHPTKACSSSGAKGSFTVEEVAAQSDKTLIRFDARSAGSDEILGSWPIKFYDLDETKNDVAAQVVERILRWRATSSSSTGDEAASFEAANLPENAQSRGANIPWRLSKEFITDIFQGGGAASERAKGSIGNTLGNWATSEGLVTTEGSTAAEFCDAIADWWPEVSFFCFSFSVYYAKMNQSWVFVFCNNRFSFYSDPKFMTGLDQARGIPRHSAVQQGPGGLQDV
jgi:hypothetical protein